MDELVKKEMERESELQKRYSELRQELQELQVMWWNCFHHSTTTRADVSVLSGRFSVEFSCYPISIDANVNGRAEIYLQLIIIMS